MTTTVSAYAATSATEPIAADPIPTSRPTAPGSGCSRLAVARRLPLPTRGNRLLITILRLYPSPSDDIANFEKRHVGEALHFNKLLRSIRTIDPPIELVNAEDVIARKILTPNT